MPCFDRLAAWLPTKLQDLAESYPQILYLQVAAWLDIWLGGWVADCLAGLVVDRLAGWLSTADWLAVRLAGCLAGPMHQASRICA